MSTQCNRCTMAYRCGMLHIKWEIRRRKVTIFNLIQPYVTKSQFIVKKRLSKSRFLGKFNFRFLKRIFQSCFNYNYLYTPLWITEYFLHRISFIAFILFFPIIRQRKTLFFLCYLLSWTEFLIKTSIIR